MPKTPGLRITLAELSGCRSRGCAGKIGYPSWQHAEHALTALLIKGKVKDETRINIYRCRECGGETYHIGHSSRGAS